MTALCRLIILHSKDADPVLVAEAPCSFGRSLYIMSAKENLAGKKEMRNNEGRN